MTISRNFTSNAPPQADRVTSSAPTILVSNAVAIGDLIVVLIIFEDGAVTVTSVMDTSGNTYAQAGAYARDTNSPSTSCIFYCLSAIAASANTNTVTVHLSASVLVCAAVQSVTSPGATWTLDKTMGGSGTSGNPASGSVTTTSASEYLVSCAYGDSSFLAADTANNWVYQYEHMPVGNLQFEGSEDQIVSSIGTFNGTWIQNASGNWSAIIATFAASGGGSPPVPSFMPWFFV